MRTAAEQIRELTGGRGAELVLDMVGSDDSIALAGAISRFESHLTVVGLAGGKFEFAFGALPFEAQLTIPYWGSAVELGEVLDLARAGKIQRPRRALRRSTGSRTHTPACGTERSRAER